MTKVPLFVDPSALTINEEDDICDVASVDTPMRQFYRGKNIFITGGTGFMGKVLTEKLLRMFPDINAIYLLVRDKKGKDVDSRMDTLYDDPLFYKLNRQHPKFRHKIISITGDCALPDLGLDIESRDLLTSRVQVVFHVAATVRFDEKLRLAVAINVGATREVLRLAKEMTKLEAILHTSTAYCNCHLNSIGEEFYSPPMNTNKMLQLIDACDDQLLDEITPTILGKWPNTYALTKAIAEDVVKEEGGDLPIVVFRPAIVVGVYQDPLPGYIDNLYGPTGVLFGAGTGVLKSLHCDPEALANVVPVDMAVSAMIASVWDVANRKAEEKEVKSPAVPIYNYVSSCENPLKWHDFVSLSERFGMEVPSMRCLWYYCFTLNKVYAIHWLYVMLLHFLPAILMDCIRYVQGKQPKMMAVYKKIDKFSNVISYFSTRTWHFENGNVRALWTRLDPADKPDFMFDMRQLDWNGYFYNYIRGCRVFLAKDQMSTLPEATRRWRRLYWIHQTVKAVIALVLLRVAWTVVSLAVNLLIKS